MGSGCGWSAALTDRIYRKTNSSQIANPASNRIVVDKKCVFTRRSGGGTATHSCIAFRSLENIYSLLLVFAFGLNWKKMFKVKGFIVCTSSTGKRNRNPFFCSVYIYLTFFVCCKKISPSLFYYLICMHSGVDTLYTISAQTHSHALSVNPSNLIAHYYVTWRQKNNTILPIRRAKEMDRKTEDDEQEKWFSSC